MAMENLVTDQSGFCSKTGIYSSKWDSQILPSQTSSLSFPSFLLSQISPQFLQKPALIDSETGNAITYQELRSLSIAVSQYLDSLDVKKGDVILVLSFNSIYFPVLVLGIMSIGAIFTTANALSTSGELQYQIKDSKPVLVFTTQELHSKFDGNLVSRPIILIEEFFEMLVNDPKTLIKPLEVMVDQNDIAALMYSSGTTGKSKGVMSTHGTQIAQSCMVRHAWEADGDAYNETHMCVVPLTHMFGFSIFICGALAVRSTTVIARKFSVEEVTVGIDKYKVTQLPVVPPMMVQLMRLQERMKGNKKNLLGDLKEVICAGAPLGKEHIEHFNKVFPQVRVSQSYGLTEANGSVTLCNGVEGNGIASVGLLLPYVEAKIIHVETQQPQPPLSFGELCIRGPYIMKGYYNNREATSLAIDKDGWFRTGDLCFIDTSGQLYVVDRIKELIKYNAYQVAPAELEEILSKHPGINDAAVTSYPDESAGEIPMACVVRKGTSKVTEEEIIAFMASKVAPYKKIRKVVFVKSIPKSPSGKILRRKLKASFPVSHPQQLMLSSKL